MAMRNRIWIGFLILMLLTMIMTIYRTSITFTSTLSSKNLSSHFPDCREDNESWSFLCRYQCPSGQILIPERIKSKTTQIFPICTDGSVFLKEMNLHRPALPVFSLNDTCLARVIEEFCYDGLPVPNVVHYVWFGKLQMTFYHFLSFYSAFKYLKPCLILVHADRLPFGPFWDRLLSIVPNLIHINRTAPSTVHGQKIPYVEHKADIARLEAVKEFGGIYLDTDEVILKSLDEFRVHNFTLGDTRYFDLKDAHLSNALILSRRNASFVNLWIDQYKNYYPKRWGYNSVIMPYLLSQNHSDLIHVVKNYTFLIPQLDDPVDKIMFSMNTDWSHNHAIHIYMRYTKQKPTFESIRSLNVTLGSVSRYVLLGTRHLCMK